MKDGTISGNGTSRLIRSVADFKTKYPTYESFCEALVSGTLPIDILFNESGWDQIPDFLNKANLLQDETNDLYGEDATAVPDDIFKNIILRILQKSFLTVKVLTTNGNPISGLKIEGITSKDGSTVVTDSQGVASGFVQQGSVELGVGNYADIQEFKKQYDFEPGKIYTDEWLVSTRDFVKFTASTKVRFSTNVEQVDVDVGGAGGSGASAATGGADGGYGGSVTRKINATFVPDTEYDLIVGAGGEALSSNTGTATRNGNDGGDSSFLGVVGKGGSGGLNGTSGSGEGGTGGNAGPGTDGGAATDKIFTSITDETDYGGGGGGGGNANNYGTTSASGGSGGFPGGGSGGLGSSSPSSGSNGTNGLGGGGGGAGGYRYSGDNSRSKNGASGKGGDGAVAVRMFLKSK